MHTANEFTLAVYKRVYDGEDCHNGKFQISKVTMFRNLRISAIPIWLTILLYALSTIEARRHDLKILGLFPHPGVSHFRFFQPILRGLAERGHEVTVLSHFPDKSPPIGYIDIPLTGRETLSDSVDLKVFENRRFYNHFIEFFMLHDWGKQACNHTLRSEALARIFKEKIRYDVILVEQFNTDCMMGVAHALSPSTPVIALSSCALMPWHYDRMGLPIIPSYIPATFLGQSEDMDLMGRLANWITFHGMRMLYDFFSTPAADAMIQYKFGHEMPSVGDLAKDTAVMFVNQHFSLSGAKPLPPSVVELGGVHIQKAKPLDVDLQKFLDNAENGVIFISWGSMIKAETMPIPKRDAILKAVKRLKQRVVWKWENDTLITKPDNLYISKWLPQRDILCHPNVKVFMTHAGLMGSSEAAYCGVPVVATPMYGDQFLNAATLKQRGMGTVLHYEDINENSVFKSLKEVLKKQYFDNAKSVSYSFKRRPQTSLELAIWWVEYVANSDGGPLLKSTSSYMPRYVYYSLDVYVIFGSILGIAFLAWVWIVRKMTIPRNVKKAKVN